MIYSYDKVYLRIAQRVLGEMLKYAVYDCGYELNEYYRLFTESSYSERFSKGDPFVIAGMSGAELAIRVMDVPDDEIVAPGYYFEKSCITILLCLLKATDAMDDIYGGFYLS